MRDEYLALGRKVHGLLFPYHNGRPIGCKWVFKIKENPDCTGHKNVARLVAKGFYQVARLDF